MDHLSMSYCNRFGLRQKHGHFGSVLFVHYSNDIGLRLTVRTATRPLETCWGDFHEIVSDRRCDTRLSGGAFAWTRNGQSRNASVFLLPHCSPALFQAYFRLQVSPAFPVSILIKMCIPPTGEMTNSNPAGNTGLVLRLRV